MQHYFSVVPFIQYSWLPQALITLIFLNFNFLFFQPCKTDEKFYQHFCLTPQPFFLCHLQIKRYLNVKRSRECQLKLHAFFFLSGIFIPYVLSPLVALCCLQPFGNHIIDPASTTALSSTSVADTSYKHSQNQNSSLFLRYQSMWLNNIKWKEKWVM